METTPIISVKGITSVHVEILAGTDLDNLKRPCMLP